MMTIALAGTGAMSAVHALAAQANGFSITAVASRRAGTGAARARQLGAAAVTYAQLPAGADLVIVCTPPARHALDAIQALQGGAAALVELPLSTTLADADRLVEAATRSGGRLGYAENVAHAPAVTAARVRRSAFGPLTHLDGRVAQPPRPWRDATIEGWGGGALVDAGPHLLATALLLAQPARPVQVQARLELADGLPVDEHAEVTLTFDTGLRAQLVASWRSPGIGQWELQAAGRTGVVRVELVPAPALEVNGVPVALPPARADLPDPRIEELGYCAQLTSFAAHLAAGREPAMSARFGRDVLDVVCAAYASAGDRGRPQALPFTGRRDRTPRQLWHG